MATEWLGLVFHIPDAATTGDLATTAMGSKAVKLKMSICFSALSTIAILTGGSGCDIRMPTQGRHVQSLRLKERS